MVDRLLDLTCAMTAMSTGEVAAEDAPVEKEGNGADDCRHEPHTQMV
jgi:hypothetical protein